LFYRTKEHPLTVLSISFLYPDELKDILRQDIKDTPVFKDLPRLANRIVILGSLSKGQRPTFFHMISLQFLFC
jgi:hypothetical protein